jgi:hypothetical protein
MPFATSCDTRDVTTMYEPSRPNARRAVYRRRAGARHGLAVSGRGTASSIEIAAGSE